MEIKVTDDFGNELDYNDIVLVSYPNERVKYLGVIDVHRADSSISVVVSDNDNDWQSFPGASYTSVRYIGKLEARPELEKLFGRSYLRTKKELKDFMDKLEIPAECLSTNH